jgi:hypothetical protein
MTQTRLLALTLNPLVLAVNNDNHCESDFSRGGGPAIRHFSQPSFQRPPWHSRLHLMTFPRNPVGSLLMQLLNEQNFRNLSIFNEKLFGVRGFQRFLWD